MHRIVLGIVGLVVSAALAGCAGQTDQLSIQGPMGQAPQSVTFPNGTTFGGASGRQASELAQIIADSNNNNMRTTAAPGHESKNLQTSQQALAILENLSNQQGTRQITLFFPRFGRAQQGREGDGSFASSTISPVTAEAARCSSC
jgi:hypothetical protein